MRQGWLGQRGQGGVGGLVVVRSEGWVVDGEGEGSFVGLWVSLWLWMVLAM